MISDNKDGVSIIIPTYNEEKIVKSTIENVLRKVVVPKEIIVVDDSNDKTEEIVKKLSEIHKEIIFIKNKSTQKGFVAAIANGLKHSNKDVVVFLMADKCDNPHTINGMYRKICQDWDVVCGSRYMKGGKRLGGPEFLGILSKLLCFFSFFLVGLPTHDVTNSFKMYRKKCLKTLKFNLLAGTAVSMELLCQAYFKGFKITEIPTTWKGRDETRFKITQRGPKYFHILNWAMNNSFRKKVGLQLRGFY